MEHLLGVTEAARSKEPDAYEHVESDQNDQLDSDDRYDAHEADLQGETEGNDRARHRYQRLFWESVAEGEVRGLVCDLGSRSVKLMIAPGTSHAQYSRGPERDFLGMFEI